MAEPQSVWKEVRSLLRNAMNLREKPPVAQGSKRVNRNLLRPDGTMKGSGWLGMLPMTGDYEGHVMTELSTGSGDLAKKSIIDQRPHEPLIPLVTPNQDPSAIAWMLAGGSPTQEIYERAKTHAAQMRAEGKSPFAPGLLVPTSERPAPYKEVYDMVGADPSSKQYIPGKMDSLPTKLGVGSDDPYGAASKLEAWRRATKEDFNDNR